MVSLFESNAGLVHRQAVKIILRHIRMTSDIVLYYHGGDLYLTSFSDTDWASDKDEH